MPGGGRTAGEACAGAAANGDGPGGGANACGRGGAGGGACIVCAMGFAVGTGGAGRVDAIMSGAGAATLVGSSASSPEPIASSIRVSPTTIVSPDCSLALLTFW